MAHQRTGENVAVSNETLTNRGRLAEVTLRLPEDEVACAPAEMTYHADDVRRALDQGKFAR